MSQVSAVHQLHMDCDLRVSGFCEIVCFERSKISNRAIRSDSGPYDVAPSFQIARREAGHDRRSGFWPVRLIENPFTLAAPRPARLIVIAALA